MIPNQRVLQVIDKKTSIVEAFKKIDSVLHQGVKGIAELITLPGLINVDFADVRSIMQDAGNAIMGMGIASGDKRAIAAIRQAISSPLLDTTIDGARGILLNIVGAEDLSMTEIDEAATTISKSVDPDANIIFGAAIDNRLMDQIKITVIATRFDENSMKLFQFQKPQEDILAPKITTPQESKIDEKVQEDISLYPPDDTEELPAPTHKLEESDEFDVPAFLRKK